MRQKSKLTLHSVTPGSAREKPRPHYMARKMPRRYLAKLGRERSPWTVLIVLTHFRGCIFPLLKGEFGGKYSIENQGIPMS